MEFLKHISRGTLDKIIQQTDEAFINKKKIDADGTELYEIKLVKELQEIFIYYLQTYTMDKADITIMEKYLPIDDALQQDKVLPYNVNRMQYYKLR